MMAVQASISLAAVALVLEEMAVTRQGHQAATALAVLAGRASAPRYPESR